VEEGMGARFGSRIPPFSLPGDGEDRPQSSFGPTYLEKFAPLLSWSTKASTVRRIIEKVAGTDATVLVRGESGVGKDLVAWAIHAASSRHGGPFVKVNCAALPAELLESELFGHEKGAFTGAYARKPGKFEFANRGTICLDEIGEVPRLLQSKLLHVLQDLQFTRLGGRETIQADARVVAITNRDLEAAIARGDFREDLYYRLNVVEIWVPPLREQPEAIPALVAHFLARFNEEYDRAIELSPDTIELFSRYSWPGNIRELENAVRRLVVLGGEGHVRDELVSRLRAGRTRPANGTGAAAGVPAGSADGREMAGLDSEGLKGIARRAAREAQRAVLLEVLERVRWNRAEAARVLKVSYKTLLGKLTECGIESSRTMRLGSEHHANGDHGKREDGLPLNDGEPLGGP
jgi:two-component system response regulator AtoC